MRTRLDNDITIKGHLPLVSYHRAVFRTQSDSASYFFSRGENNLVKKKKCQRKRIRQSFPPALVPFQDTCSRLFTSLLSEPAFVRLSGKDHPFVCSLAFFVLLWNKWLFTSMATSSSTILGNAFAFVYASVVFDRLLLEPTICLFAFSSIHLQYYEK